MYMYMYIVRGGDIIIKNAVHVHKSYRLAVAVKGTRSRFAHAHEIHYVMH